MTTASAWPPRKYVKSKEMKRRKVQGKEIGEEEGKSSFYFFTAGEEKRSREENDQEQTTYKDRRLEIGDATLFMLTLAFVLMPRPHAANGKSCGAWNSPSSDAEGQSPRGCVFLRWRPPAIPSADALSSSAAGPTDDEEE